MAEMSNGMRNTIYQRHKFLSIHAQRSACLTPYANFRINDSKPLSTIHDDAVYLYFPELLIHHRDLGEAR